MKKFFLIACVFVGSGECVHGMDKSLLRPADSIVLSKVETQRKLEFYRGFLIEKQAKIKHLGDDPYVREDRKRLLGEIENIEMQIKLLEEAISRINSDLKKEQSRALLEKDPALVREVLVAQTTQEVERTKQADAESAAKIAEAHAREVEAEAAAHAQIGVASERSKQVHKVVAGIPLGIAGLMAGYFVLRHYFAPRPTIIERDDTSIRSILERARGVRMPQSNLNQLVLPPLLECRIANKFGGIRRAIYKHLPMSNMLFWGPPGTGKTMAAQAFVRKLSEDGVAHHVIIRGGAFKRLESPSKAQRALADVLRWARQSKRPVVFVFDEAEVMFIDRQSTEATEMTKDLTTTMLSFFEKAAHKDMMFIMSTNFPDKLDRALLSRIDKANWIHFEKPGQAELVKLLELYFTEHLIRNGFELSDSIKDDLPVFAELIEGMVGREVDALATQLIYTLLNNDATQLTREMAMQAIDDFKNTPELHAY